MHSLRACAITAVVAGLAALSPARAAEPIPLADFFRPPAYAGPTLSRDGRYFAVTVPHGEKMNLAVVDLETNKASLLTSFKDFDVRGVTWLGSELLVFSLGLANAPTGAGNFDGGGLFMVSRDGKESKAIWPTVRELRAQGRTVYRTIELVDRVQGSEDEVIVSGNLRDADAQDLYRLNVRTGKRTLLTERRPARTVDWVLDNKQQPRIVRAYDKDYQIISVHARSDAGEWEVIATQSTTKPPAFVPMAFEEDDKTLQVATNRDRETMAVFRYDLASRKLGEMVASHPRYDMGANQRGEEVPGVLYNSETGKIVGYRVEAERTQTVWTDPDYDRIQKMVDAALPGTENRISLRSPKQRKVLVTAGSDRSPTRWYMLDTEQKTLQELFVARPWIKPDHLVEQRPFTFKSRDGLELPGYYFLPAGAKPGDRLPTIVHIHGGPQVRDTTFGSGFGWMEGQLLASRGYAVIVPEFRITPGLGSKIYYSGFGTLGRQMIDDHADAAKWAIDQGIADPKRICMSGASYGGYATLMSLARYPEIFRCGVAGLIVSDWIRIVTSGAGDLGGQEGTKAWARDMAGVKSLSDFPPELNPVNLADRIKQPLLIYAGADDIRTPIEQTDAMVSALKRAGNEPKAVIVKAKEGHGYGKAENNVDLYTRVFEFLDQSIGKKATSP